MYRYIKLDLFTVGRFCFHFSRILGGVVDYVNVNPVCALTKEGTVLKDLVILIGHG